MLSPAQYDAHVTARDEAAAERLRAVLSAMASKADGIILLDLNGVVTFANERAKEILSAGDALRWSCGRVVACRGPEDRRLQQIIAAAIASACGAGAARPSRQALVSRSGGARPLIIRVLPTTASAHCQTALSYVCAIQIYDLAPAPALEPALLRELFGLTAREADLAVALIGAATLVDAAAVACMAHNTARNHLQRIFLKCGTHSQAATQALFAALPRPSRI